MTPEKLSSIISLVVAIVILLASFFQWWDISFNGFMITKRWTKMLFFLCILALGTALVLLVM